MAGFTIKARRNIFTVVVFLVLMMMNSSFQPVKAVRPFHGEEWLLSLQHAPVPPARTPSPCHTIPGNGNGGRCPPLSGMNFAGGLDDIVRAPPTALSHNNVIVVNSGSTLGVVNESDN
ncbi:hypothetical protein BVC80_441g30 [Macleaya cordata]|uniref:Uncharacterized protein n=1 Tax=Macleaya cordata TaxID=56857 RepID=A0A200Q491_MACCD|nr:hypothetical protein BVC80_441g30 [Macleaya cordata]